MGCTYNYVFVEKTVRSGRWVPVEETHEEFGKYYHLWEWIHNNKDKVEFDYDHYMVVFPKEFVEDTYRRLRALRPLLIRHIAFYTEHGRPYFNDPESETVKRIFEYWLPTRGDETYNEAYIEDLYRTLQVFDRTHIEKLEDGSIQMALTW